MHINFHLKSLLFLSKMTFQVLVSRKTWQLPQESIELSIYNTFHKLSHIMNAIHMHGTLLKLKNF